MFKLEKIQLEGEKKLREQQMLEQNEWLFNESKINIDLVKIFLYNILENVN